MMNDIGGIVYVSANELCIIFSVGVKQTLKIDTRELLLLIESRTKECWKTKEFEIEPWRKDEDGAVMSVITVRYDETYDDCAVVFRCDLLEALREIGCTEKV